MAETPNTLKTKVSEKHIILTILFEYLIFYKSTLVQSYLQRKKVRNTERNIERKIERMKERDERKKERKKELKERKKERIIYFLMLSMTTESLNNTENYTEKPSSENLKCHKN